MKKVALVFVLAVLVPSLLLAWLAVRSLRDQQFLLERQQSLLDQHVTDSLAQDISDYLAQRQQEFSAQVESLAAAEDARSLASKFDDELRKRWPFAEVGFCVTTSGKILSPLPNARPAAQMFRLDNSGFLGNREPVEVYLAANANNNNANSSFNNSTLNFSHGQFGQSSAPRNANLVNNSSAQTQEPYHQEIKSPVQAGNVNAAAPASQTATELALDTQAAAPSQEANAGSQAYALSDNITRNSSGPRANSFQNTANGFYIPPGSQSAQQQKTPSNLPATETGGFGSAPSSRAASAGATSLENNVIPSGAVASTAEPGQTAALPKDQTGPSSAASPPQQAFATSEEQIQNMVNSKAAKRKVSPLSQLYQANTKSVAEDKLDDSQDNLSKVIPAEAEFRQLIGDQTDGMLARFLQDKLKLMCWHRLSTAPDLIFGAQLNLDRIVDGLHGLVHTGHSWGDEICVAVLDDNARPVVLSRDGFQAAWKRPFVATEVGDALPHWEVAAYLVNPEQLTQAARTAKLTLGLLIAVLVVAIGIGSLLIVKALGNELRLARQKTDFVSNVSHELKTPLTSIRMFSELLAEGRVTDQTKQHSYLQIIAAEAARLTRLINNVLDFSRMERGEKKYNFQPCDLAEIVRGTAGTFRPHLESNGFQFVCELPEAPVPVRGDPDALSQIIVNLLSNAEKYSNGGKEVSLQLVQKQTPLSHAEIKVLDRGPGVPHGSEEKIFEKFYRAHDSLSSGVQGSGLGLTIARQIARAHGGEVVYEPRDSGGSCFILRVPISTADERG